MVDAPIIWKEANKLYSASSEQPTTSIYKLPCFLTDLLYVCDRFYLSLKLRFNIPEKTVAAIAFANNNHFV